MGPSLWLYVYREGGFFCFRFTLIHVSLSAYDMKIFSAYLKGLLKYRRMAFFFLKYLFSF